MKIRKAENKPMEIHIKGTPKLRIHSGKKRIKGRSAVRTAWRSPLSGKEQGRNVSRASITLKRKSLYTMGRMGAEKAAGQIEGGEELEESAEVTALALSSAYGSTEQMSRIARKKKAGSRKEGADRNGLEQNRAEGRKRSRRKDSGSVHAMDSERKKQAIKAKGSHVREYREQEGKDSGKKKKKGIRARMFSAFFARAGQEKEGQNSAAGKEKEPEIAVLRKVTAAVLPLVLVVFSIMAVAGTVVAAVTTVIYHSPLAVFFPLPDTGYDSPRTVLESYYSEFNREIMEIEDSGDEIAYQNVENGAPVSNFKDTLMVYMILYGDGKAGYVMDDMGKKNLKKVFDEMNYTDQESSAAEKEVGDSLGKVWVTAYCPCSQCCGPYANGITASGRKAKAKHTIAVDAYNPIVPMGTKVVIEGITYTVEDTGNLNHYGNDFDIFFARHSDTGQWGRRHVEAYLAEGNTNKVMVTSSGTTVHNLTYEDYIKKGTLSKEQEKMLADMMGSELWAEYYSSAAGQAVAELAMTKIGCRYDQGRRYEEGYYDCSSLVQRLYKEAGIELPATAAEQGRYCCQNAMLINKKDLKPGDLIFYSYEDNGQFRNIYARPYK